MFVDWAAHHDGSHADSCYIGNRSWTVTTMDIGGKHRRVGTHGRIAGFEIFVKGTKADMSLSAYWGAAWQFTFLHVLIIVFVGGCLVGIVRKAFESNGWPSFPFQVFIVLVCVASVLLQFLP